TLRLIEGLGLSGLPAGSTFTEKQACTLLQRHISRKSIRKALAAHYPSGQPIFPPDNPPAEADLFRSENMTKKCSLSLGKKESKALIGRAPQSYRLPTPEQMLA